MSVDTAKMMGMSEERRAEYNAKYAVHREKYHTDGHATPAEACECYKLYQLDNSLSFHPGDDIDAALKRQAQIHYCEVCKAPTTSWAHIVGELREFPLCKAHLNREAMEQIYTMGASMAS